MLSQLWTSFLLVTFLILLYVMKCHFNNRLDKVPGPFLRSISPAIRVWSAWTGKSHLHDLELHRRYGPIIRVAPNILSISDVNEISRIYGASSRYFAGKMLDPLRVYDEEGLFPDISVMVDKAMHSRVKKGSAHAYSMSTVLKQESIFDEKLKKLLEFLDEYADKGKECDFSMDARCFTLDLILHLTLGKDFDLLRDESERWILDPMDEGLMYATVVGQIPWLHWILQRDWIYRTFFKRKDYFLEEIIKWTEDEIYSASKMNEESNAGPPTFLKQLLIKKSQDPSSITDRELLADVFLNIAAGFDTTSTTICATLIQLLDHPSAYKRVVSEIRESVTDPCVSYADASKLPYLNAVIKESMRISSPAQLMLPREVPAEGDTICGTFVAGGVQVGINPFICQRDSDTFENPGDFLPERWMTDDQEALRRMNRVLLVFSAGQHACPGKFVANMAILKTVASLLLRYDIKYAEGAKVECVNYFVGFQRGFRVRLEKAGDA